MLRLENIKRINNIVKCDFYPEDCKTAVSFSYDFDTEDVQCVLPKGYEYCGVHIAQAVHWLESMKNEQLPKEKVIMWY